MIEVVELIKEGSLKEATIILMEVVVKLNDEVETLKNKVETLEDFTNRGLDKLEVEKEPSGFSIG